jgi:hypothetical protein
MPKLDIDERQKVWDRIGRDTSRLLDTRAYVRACVADPEESNGAVFEAIEIDINRALTELDTASKRISGAVEDELQRRADEIYTADRAAEANRDAAVKS